MTVLLFQVNLQLGLPRAPHNALDNTTKHSLQYLSLSFQKKNHADRAKGCCISLCFSSTLSCLVQFWVVRIVSVSATGLAIISKLKRETGGYLSFSIWHYTHIQTPLLPSLYLFWERSRELARVATFCSPKGDETRSTIALRGSSWFK